MMNLSTLDICLIILYILGFALIGFICSKKVKTAKDFTAAGQNLPLKIVIGSSIATCLGAGVLFANYERIHAFGISGIIWVMGWYIGWLMLVPISRQLRASGATSLPGFLETRFNPTTRKCASWFVLISMISLSASVFLAFGNACAALGICSVKTGTIVGTIIIVIFTFVSGLWGVTVTDSIQTIIILVGCGIFMPIIAIKNVGGLGTIGEYVSSTEFLSKGIAPFTLLGYFLSNFLGAGADASFAQRTFASKDAKTAAIGQTIACIISCVVSLIAMIPALTIGFFYPNIQSGAQFTPLFVADYFPIGLKGVMLAVLCGLLLTTGDSYLMLISSTIVDDFVRPMKKDIDDKKLIGIGRLTIAIGAVIIVILALYMGSIYELIALGGSAYGAAVFFPLHVGCRTRKLSTKAVNIAIVAGGLTSFVWDLLKLSSRTGIRGVFIGVALNLIICLAGTMIVKKSENKVEEV